MSIKLCSDVWCSVKNTFERSNKVDTKWSDVNELVICDVLLIAVAIHLCGCVGLSRALVCSLAQGFAEGA